MTYQRPPLLKSGDRFGRWTIVSEADPDKNGRRWCVQCNCGTNRVLRQAHLRTGHSKSCGCLNKELKAAQLRARTTTHGLSDTPEFRIWTGILNRCFNPNEPAYPKYGGRGILVADAWRHDFLAFLAAVGPRPSNEHSMDRIDNSRGYEPGNVRWATRTEQNRNRSNTSFVEIDGTRKPLAAAAEEMGIKRATLAARKRRQGRAAPCA